MVFSELGDGGGGEEELSCKCPIISDVTSASGYFPRSNSDVKLKMAFKTKWWERWLARAFHVLLTTGVITALLIKDTGTNCIRFSSLSPLM